jgi:hypothetical protein
MTTQGQNIPTPAAHWQVVALVHLLLMRSHDANPATLLLALQATW